MSNFERKIRRVEYVAECPPIFNRSMGEDGRQLSGKYARMAGHPGTLVRRSKVEAEPGRFRPRTSSTNVDRHSFHVWAIANDLRSKSFQLRMRHARHMMGLDETSSSMHRLHGRAIGSLRNLRQLDDEQRREDNI